MKIENAYLCVDCQEVTESDSHGGCDVCGSVALLNLAKILDRNSQKGVLNFVPRASTRIADADENVLFCITGQGRSKQRAI